MKDSEFFARAISDVTFRRAKLKEFSYMKRASAILAVCWAVFALGIWLYYGIAADKWTMGCRPLITTAVCVCGYLTYGTRVAALQALESQQPTSTASA